MAHSIVYSPELHPKHDHISALKTRPFYHGLPAPLHVISARSATMGELQLAHDSKYVARIFSGEQDHGFGTVGGYVAEHSAWTVGAMIVAAEQALRQKTPVCAPVAGFHHAGHAYASGFCTFNGLMVAALKAVKQGVKKVVIVDLDTHYGDGTDSIIGEVDYYPSQIINLTHGIPWTRDWSILRRQLEDSLPIVLADADLVLYQGGMDAHVDDEIGPGYLDASQLAERDRIVFQACKDADVPVAWCLAGGYQSMAKIVALHWQTWNVMMRVYG